jgi:hypothetical protein
MVIPPDKGFMKQNMHGIPAMCIKVIAVFSVLQKMKYVYQKLAEG